MSHEKCIAFLARTEEERLLLAHTEDLLARSEGSIVSGDFLNLGEQYLIRAFLTQCGKTENTDYAFFGGYPAAERRILYLFPSYMADSLQYLRDTEMPAEDTADPIAAMCAEEGCIRALKITGSGYRELSHRDYLGSLLALGIDRSVIGDIAVLDTRSAVLFVKSAMAEYLVTALERIGSDKVHIRPLTDEEGMQTADTRRWEVFSDTVASLRLDGIVAAAANLSRDKAKQLVSGGFVDVDFRPCDAPDAELVPGTYLSIRGHGRYLFSDVDGTSKKGRIRIRIKKLI